MDIEPSYGETSLEPEEAGALTPQVREIFGDQPHKIELYEAEQAINDDVSIALLDDIVDGRLALPEILTDTFLRELHQKLYGDLWTWADRYRTRDLNIGVGPARIAIELRGSLDNIRYRWEHTDDWTPRELGIAVHALPSASTASSTGTDEARVCSLTSSSSRRKTPRRSRRRTTGASTRRRTSRYCASTTSPETRNRSPSSSPSGGSTTPRTGDQIGDQKPPDQPASAGGCR